MTDIHSGCMVLWCPQLLNLLSLPSSNPSQTPPPPPHHVPQFWNCADIRILPVGVPLPSPSASPPPSPPLPVSPPMPDPNPSSPAPSGNATLTDPCRSGNATCYCAWQSRDGMFADAEAGCTVSALRSRAHALKVIPDHACSC